MYSFESLKSSLCAIDHEILYSGPDLIVPLVDAEDGVGKGVVTKELALLAHQATQNT